MVDQNLLDDCENEHDIAMSGAVAHVYLLWARGDHDYHSGSVPGVFKTLEAAQAAMLKLGGESVKACPDEPNCPFYYEFMIEKLEVNS
tara:strand:+ start:171 stop:434 length:264 start_codon:yes stop_codon:yes gene_type:complete